MNPAAIQRRGAGLAQAPGHEARVEIRLRRAGGGPLDAALAAIRRSARAPLVDATRCCSPSARACCFRGATPSVAVYETASFGCGRACILRAQHCRHTSPRAGYVRGHQGAKPAEMPASSRRSSSGPNLKTEGHGLTVPPVVPSAPRRPTISERHSPIATTAGSTRPAIARGRWSREDPRVLRAKPGRADQAILYKASEDRRQAKRRLSVGIRRSYDALRWRGPAPGDGIVGPAS